MSKIPTFQEMYPGHNGKFAKNMDEFLIRHPECGIEVKSHHVYSMTEACKSYDRVCRFKKLIQPRLF